MFTQGQRVIATMDDGREELGRVAYQRMDPCADPPFSKPLVVSVLLDSKRDRIGYAGTILVAEKVRPSRIMTEGSHGLGIPPD